MRLGPDPHGAEVGLSRRELVDGLAECLRGLDEVREAAADRDFTPAEQSVWDHLMERAVLYRAAVEAIDAAPPDE